jgi:hypothetical protein
MKRERSVMMTVLMPAGMEAEIVAFARENGMSRSAAVRYMVAQYLRVNFANTKYKMGENQSDTESAG